MKKTYLILSAAIVLSLSQQVFASDFRNYNEDVVRAYKAAKIQTLKPSIKLDVNADEAAIDSAVQAYLKEQNFFNKTLKGKSGIFIVDTQKDEQNIKINKIYNLKNPEKFLFCMNKSFSRESFQNKEILRSTIADDVLIYSTISEKIENKNKPFALKATKASTNAFLELFIMVPKMGLGGIINQPFKWMQMGTPDDIYKGISKEVEEISVGEKEIKPVKLFTPQ